MAIKTGNKPLFRLFNEDEPRTNITGLFPVRRFGSWVLAQNPNGTALAFRIFEMGPGGGYAQAITQSTGTRGVSAEATELSVTPLRAEQYPILASVWDNDEDDIFDSV